MISLSNVNTIFSKKFQKEFHKFSEQTQKEVKKSLFLIFAGKKNANIKQLRNYKYAEFRLKIGKYRLLFSKDEQEKYIFLRIKHRKNLY